MLDCDFSTDDPAFIVVITFFMFIASLAYSVTFGVESFWHFIRIVVGSVAIEFLLFGAVIASTLRYLGNKHLRMTSRVAGLQEQSVEALYAFDVHCNAFFPLFLILFVGQFVFIPFIVHDGFSAVFIGNTFYLVALSYYWYITFLGYSALPFLYGTQNFLLPIPLLVLVYMLSLLFQWNIGKTVLSLYFSH